MRGSGERRWFLTVAPGARWLKCFKSFTLHPVNDVILFICSVAGRHLPWCRGGAQPARFHLYFCFLFIIWSPVFSPTPGKKTLIYGHRTADSFLFLQCFSSESESVITACSVPFSCIIIRSCPSRGRRCLALVPATGYWNHILFCHTYSLF